MRHSLETCTCSSVDVAPARRFASSLQVQVMAGNLPDKARIYPGAGVIQVGGPWWNALNAAQRACVLAHERAHEENQREDCESCIDMRAAAILRHEGWSRDAVVDGFRSTVQTREAGKAAGRGWDAADKAIESGMATQNVPAAVADDTDADAQELAIISDRAVNPAAPDVLVEAGPGSFFDSSAGALVVAAVFVVAIVVIAKKL